MEKRKVDINVATGDEIASLLGIEESMAEAIIEHRTLSGRFNSVEDLLLVPGIGPGLLDLTRDQLCFHSLEEETLQEPKPPPVPPPPPPLPPPPSPSVSHNSLDRDTKWASILEMSVWNNGEVDAKPNNEPHGSSSSAVPVAACSHNSHPVVDKPSSSGQCVVKTIIKKKVIRIDPVKGLRICVHSRDRKTVTFEEGLARATDQSTSRDCVNSLLKMNGKIRSKSLSHFQKIIPPKREELVSGADCGLGLSSSCGVDVVDDMESLASDQSDAVDDEDDDDDDDDDEDDDDNNLLLNSPELTFEHGVPLGSTIDSVLRDFATSKEGSFSEVTDADNKDDTTFNREKILMKRKPELDSREPLLGKKPCLTGNGDGQGAANMEPGPEVHDKAAHVALLKKRIPTKDNPPPELAKWLETFQLWGNAERLMAIDQLIDLCEPTQVRHMMSVIEPQFQRDFISLLPKELALYVLSFLEPKYLLRAAQTCRYWRVLAEDNLLWREKCREAGIEELRDALGKRRPKIGFAPSPWKAAYMRQHNIEMNWRFRPIRPPKVLKGHDDHVITCLQFCGSRIVSGSDDNTLKVWSATTGKCLKTLVGHTGGVWSSQMAGNIIVSGSTDRTLKVWNADTGQCIHTLYGHTSTVRCMHLHGNIVVSGSRDATLRVWDIGTGQCLHVLVGHVAAVRCVQYDGRLVVSGAYDYVVKVWNPEREECLHTLQGHTNRVYSLQFDGVHVVSGSLDTSIRVWDVETGACKHTLMGHQSLTSGMELKNNILVSGNADSTVKVWDIKTGQCLQTLSGTHKHNSAVTCLQFNSKFVITSSDDGTVKLWDLKTGEFIRNLVALHSGGSGGVVWRIRASPTKLVCAVGSRNGTEETKLLVLDFDVDVK